MAAARQAALNVLVRIEKEQAYAAAALASELKGMQSKREAALATELVLGVTRRRPFLDTLLNTVAARGIQNIDIRTLNILRMGVYQIVFLDGIPARAAVSESVELTKRSTRKGLGSLVNALLRRLSEMPVSELRPREIDTGGSLRQFAPDLGIPRFLLKRLAEAHGRSWVFDVAKTFNSPSRRTLRVNTNHIPREKALIELGEESSPGLLTPWSVDVPNKAVAESFIDSGRAVYQDEGAQLVVVAMEATPGEKLLDACSGRGGKTSALTMCTHPDAKIYAVDRGKNKLDRLTFELQKQGFRAKTICADLTSPHLDLEETFDKILLDAPCSGSGTIGRRPEIRWRLSPDTIDSLVRIQEDMLGVVTRFLRPGGLLVYSVCSLLPEEGLHQGEKFIESHPNFSQNRRVPDEWPTSVPWNDGFVFVDPAQTGTDGYQILSFRKAE